MLPFLLGEHMIRSILRLRWLAIITLLRIWIVTWLLAVPLFHVHLDTAHHHNESGAHHGGIAHTIYSGDLKGEFGNPHTESTKGLLTHSGCSYQDAPELGFSLLSDASDRNVCKPFLAVVSVLAIATLRSPEISDWITSGKIPLPRLPFLQKPPLRAPPYMLL